MYREHRPPAELAGLVECVWRHELAEPGSDQTAVILPDGRLDVVWTLGGDTLVAGPQTHATPRPHEPPFVTIGIRFHPGAAPPLLGLAAHELVDLHVPLEQLDTRPAAALSRRLDGLEDPDDAVWALLGALDLERAPDPLVRAAARLLDAPRATVDGVARELALSDRELQRRFREAVGYGPKTLQRILRFQRFVAGLDGADGLAGVAAASGYADQAHLSREARRLSGLTPSRLQRLWASDRSPRAS